MAEQIIAQAAEAIIIKKANSVIKRRVKKGYRIPELDEKLRKLRTRSEAKLLEKASSLISVPRVIKVSEKDKEIELDFIEGKKLSEHLDNLKDKEKIMENLGTEVAKLHNNNIIHGDLTTSNMILAENKIKSSSKNSSQQQVKILSKENELITEGVKLTQSERASAVHEEASLKISEPSSRGEVYIIDFGLGFISARLEDKAVDIHLLKQALEAKHFKFHNELLQAFLKGYKKESKDASKILEQLKKVEARGRYKHE